MRHPPSILLTKVHSREAALRIVDSLQGQSYMQFVVEVCPYQGEFHINVSTHRADTTKEELNDMLLQVLAMMTFSRLLVEEVRTPPLDETAIREDERMRTERGIAKECETRAATLTETANRARANGHTNTAKCRQSDAETLYSVGRWVLASNYETL